MGAKEALESAMTVAHRTAEEAKERGNERFRLQRSVLIAYDA